MSDTCAVSVLEAIRTIAFVGDLAMGQPTDHSWRASCLARRLARVTGGSDELCAEASIVALLRWSGCTANAHEFAQLFGDDVAQRESLLALPSSGSGFRQSTQENVAAFFALSKIHCEVAGDIAGLLGLSESTQFALRHLFESFDGHGAPDGLAGDAVPPAVYLAAAAGDLEIFHRIYGLQQACYLIGQRAGRQYPHHVAEAAMAHAREWLMELEADGAHEEAQFFAHSLPATRAPLEVLADVVDLKLPWLTGHSRLAATLARDAARRLGLNERMQQRLYGAGLIHGIGRTAVPNMIWDTPAKLSESAWERVRLVPYWTSRAGKLLRSLEDEVRLASFAYERLDGSGYFRGLTAPDIPLEGRILAAAVAMAALRGPRPWRDAFTSRQAGELLLAEANNGRFEKSVVRALLPEEQQGLMAKPATFSAPSILTDREREVLRYISLGASNKAVALKLSISASTVRTHVESVFRKLECTTRAAATLKAAQLGLLEPVTLPDERLKEFGS
ncbi:HD domain-containing phosphohydrolase [Dyella silvae]|uniref:HD domain-containing phosphohydrolase n=1 Tax=Dyella silvae TaxID=2994424 RepID=UPI002263B246|nr:HD domain-containing phosphohydrolase [Dyella silvae]